MSRRTRAQRDERGSASIFVIGFAMVLFLCGGLVIDGGLAINKRMRVADQAEQAARAGADVIDVNVFRATDQVVINRPEAETRMRQYLGRVGFTGQVDIGWRTSATAPSVPVVTLQDTSKTYILGLFNVKFDVRATAEAVPDTGAGGGGGAPPLTQ